MNKDRFRFRMAVLLIAAFGIPAVLVGLVGRNTALSKCSCSAGMFDVEVSMVMCGDMHVWEKSTGTVSATQQVLCQDSNSQPPQFRTECRVTVQIPRQLSCDLETGQRVVLGQSESSVVAASQCSFPPENLTRAQVVSVFETGGADDYLTVVLSDNKTAERFTEGHSAAIWVDADTEYSIPYCPLNAISNLDDGPYVFVVQEDPSTGRQIVVRRNVKLGMRDLNAVEIVSGVSPGDRVVMSGVQTILEGASVNIINIRFPSN